MINIFLRKFYNLMLIILLLIGLPFFYLHTSINPQFGQFSIKFLCFLFLPYLSIFLITILFYKKKIYLAQILITQKNNEYFKGIVLSALFLIFLIFLYIYTIIKITYISTLLIFITISFILFITDKVFDWVKILIPGFIFISFGIFLFSTEIIYLLVYKSDNHKNKKLYSWGNEDTFKHTSRDEIPFISSGGRFKNNLDLKIYSQENQNGVSLITNDIGLRNKVNFNIHPKPNTLRILNIGDSFSIGFNISQKNFFGYQLEYLLSKSLFPKKVEVLNSEVSDPAIGSYYLQNYYHNFNPDVVIYGLGINDIMQSDLFLGGNALLKFNKSGKISINENYDKEYSKERFQSYKNLKNSIKMGNFIWRNIDNDFLEEWLRRIKGFKILNTFYKSIKNILPEQEQVQRFSYFNEIEKEDNFKRLIDGESFFGYFISSTPSSIQEMYNNFFKLLSFMDKECKKNGSRFILIIFPHRYQLKEQVWNLYKDLYNFNESDFDLKLMNKIITDYCTKENINFVDPFNSLSVIKDQLYLNFDNHMNSKGHKLVAQEVSNYIENNIK